MSLSFIVSFISVKPYGRSSFILLHKAMFTNVLFQYMYSTVIENILWYNMEELVDSNLPASLTHKSLSPLFIYILYKQITYLITLCLNTEMATL